MIEVAADESVAGAAVIAHSKTVMRSALVSALRLTTCVGALGCSLNRLDTGLGVALLALARRHTITATSLTQQQEQQEQQEPEQQPTQQMRPLLAIARVAVMRALLALTLSPPDSAARSAAPSPAAALSLSCLLTVMSAAAAEPVLPARLCSQGHAFAVAFLAHLVALQATRSATVGSTQVAVAPQSHELQSNCVVRDVNTPYVVWPWAPLRARTAPAGAGSTGASAAIKTLPLGLLWCLDPIEARLPVSTALDNDAPINALTPGSPAAADIVTAPVVDARALTGHSGGTIAEATANVAGVASSVLPAVRFCARGLPAGMGVAVGVGVPGLVRDPNNSAANGSGAPSNGDVDGDEDACDDCDEGDDGFEGDEDEEAALCDEDEDENEAANNTRDVIEDDVDAHRDGDGGNTGERQHLEDSATDIALNASTGGLHSDKPAPPSRARARAESSGVLPLSRRRPKSRSVARSLSPPLASSSRFLLQQQLQHRHARGASVGVAAGAACEGGEKKGLLKAQSFLSPLSHPRPAIGAAARDLLLANGARQRRRHSNSAHRDPVDDDDDDDGIGSKGSLHGDHDHEGAAASDGVLSGVDGVEGDDALMFSRRRGRGRQASAKANSRGDDESASQRLQLTNAENVAVKDEEEDFAYLAEIVPFPGDDVGLGTGFLPTLPPDAPLAYASAKSDDIAVDSAVIDGNEENKEPLPRLAAYVRSLAYKVVFQDTNSVSQEHQQYTTLLSPHYRSVMPESILLTTTDALAADSATAVSVAPNTTAISALDHYLALFASSAVSASFADPALLRLLLSGLRHCLALPLALPSSIDSESETEAAAVLWLQLQLLLPLTHSLFAPASTSPGGNATVSGLDVIAKACANCITTVIAADAAAAANFALNSTDDLATTALSPCIAICVPGSAPAVASTRDTRALALSSLLTLLAVARGCAPAAAVVTSYVASTTGAVATAMATARAHWRGRVTAVSAVNDAAADAVALLDAVTAAGGDTTAAAAASKAVAESARAAEAADAAFEEDLAALSLDFAVMTSAAGASAAKRGFVLRYLAEYADMKPTDATSPVP